MTVKLMVFWDYDTQWGADRSRLKGPRDWGHLEFENTERLLELHDQYQVPACFAVVGAAARQGERPYCDPAQIRQIHASGHEVASHSLFHDWLPALNSTELRQTLRESKDTLEQCIGAAVTAFVPPYNQPFDYIQRGSISLSERRAVKHSRTDIPVLAQALCETGYTFARISYRTPKERLLGLLNRHDPRPPLTKPEIIRDVTCLRISNPAGFHMSILDPLTLLSPEAQNGYLIVYGHPHSLHKGSPQDEKYLVPFLTRVRELANSGRIEIILPKQVFANVRT